MLLLLLGRINKCSCCTALDASHINSSVASCTELVWCWLCWCGCWFRVHGISISTTITCCCCGCCILCYRGCNGMQLLMLFLLLFLLLQLLLVMSLLADRLLLQLLQLLLWWWCISNISVCCCRTRCGKRVCAQSSTEAALMAN